MKKKPLSARKPSNKNNSSLESPLEIKTFNDLEWDLAEGINFNVGPNSFKKYTISTASSGGVNPPAPCSGTSDSSGSSGCSSSSGGCGGGGGGDGSDGKGVDGGDGGH